MRAAALDLAPLVALLDEPTIVQLAERLRPHLASMPEGAHLLTTQQAAERLGLHRKTVARMARDGRLPASKVGQGWRFRADDLDVKPARLSAGPAAASPSPPRQRAVPTSVQAIRGSSGSGGGRA